MKGKAIAVVLVASMPATLANAETPVGGKGFTCVAQNGAIRRYNIDLQRKRYQEAGEAPKKIAKIVDAKITLYNFSAPWGDLYSDTSLDRSTLVLTVYHKTGQEIISLFFQCQMGEPFNFAAERQF